jgi:hypothetical protein
MTVSGREHHREPNFVNFVDKNRHLANIVVEPMRAEWYR